MFFMFSVEILIEKLTQILRIFYTGNFWPWQFTQLARRTMATMEPTDTQVDDTTLAAWNSRHSLHSWDQ